MARCLDALATVASVDGADLFLRYLSDVSAAVRAAAAEGFGHLASGRQVVDTLGPFLLDPSPKVAGPPREH